MTTAASREEALRVRGQLSENRAQVLLPTAEERQAARRSASAREATLIKLARELAHASVENRLTRRLRQHQAETARAREEGTSYDGPSRSQLKQQAHGWRRAAQQRFLRSLQSESPRATVQKPDTREDWRRYRREQEGWQPPPPPRFPKKHRGNVRGRRLRQKLRSRAGRRTLGDQDSSGKVIHHPAVPEADAAMADAAAAAAAAPSPTGAQSSHQPWSGAPTAAPPSPPAGEDARQSNGTQCPLAETSPPADEDARQSDGTACPLAEHVSSQEDDEDGIAEEVDITGNQPRRKRRRENQGAHGRRLRRRRREQAEQAGEPLWCSSDEGLGGDEDLGETDRRLQEALWQSYGLATNCMAGDYKMPTSKVPPAKAPAPSAASSTPASSTSAPWPDLPRQSFGHDDVRHSRHPRPDKSAYRARYDSFDEALSRERVRDLVAAGLQKHPMWACSSCGQGGNWHSRTKCRVCGHSADRPVSPKPAAWQPRAEPPASGKAAASVQPASEPPASEAESESWGTWKAPKEDPPKASKMPAPRTPPKKPVHPSKAESLQPKAAQPAGKTRPAGPPLRSDQGKSGQQADPKRPPAKSKDGAGQVFHHPAPPSGPGMRYGGKQHHWPYLRPPGMPAMMPAAGATQCVPKPKPGYVVVDGKQLPSPFNPTAQAPRPPPKQQQPPEPKAQPARRKSSAKIRGSIFVDPAKEPPKAKAKEKAPQVPKQKCAPAVARAKKSPPPKAKEPAKAKLAKPMSPAARAKSKRTAKAALKRWEDQSWLADPAAAAKASSSWSVQDPKAAAFVAASEAQGLMGPPTLLEPVARPSRAPHVADDGPL